MANAGIRRLVRCVLAASCIWGYFSLPGFSRAQASKQNAEGAASRAAVPPEHAPNLPVVMFRDGQLWIVAYNATLGDVLAMVGKQTGAALDIPVDVNERVVVQLGPGPVRRVLGELLAGSDFNFVMLGSQGDPQAIAKLVLTRKPGNDDPTSPQLAELRPQPSYASIVRRSAIPRDPGPPLP
ncbi:MAG: hypothetical protein JO041_11075 [Acidobacteria bacterium]|nr:hypothetical protein [Acidobacteriota bacterium]